jgi:hypothetical protein
MFKSLTRWVAVAILSISAVSAANAAVINYTGDVSFSTDLALIGTSFSGSLTYSNAPLNPGGTYLDVISAADITLGGTTYNFVSPISSTIQITNDPTLDGFAASLVDAVGGLNFVNVFDFTGTTFPGLEPILSTNFAFDFSSPFTSGFVTMDAFGIFMDGELTSLSTVAALPEPSILALLGVGLLGMFFVRRKLSA